MNLTFLPPWSLRLVCAGVAVLLGLAILRWRRERRGALVLALRVLLLLLLAFILADPQAFTPRQRLDKPKLAVLLDTSSSMATRDVQGGSRFELALRQLTNSANLAALQKEFTLDFRGFDRDQKPLSPGELSSALPKGEASDLGRALMSVVSDLGQTGAQAGVLVVSDGRATSPDTLDAAQLALARSVPLWTWTLGGPVPRHDLWIETASTEALAFAEADVELSATLRQAGYSNRSFNVEILRGDKVIETREVLPGADDSARVSVRVKAPKAGEQRFVLRVPPQPEEGETANNERSVFLRAVGEKVRVLLAEGQPHWDTKFLVQGLKRDLNVDMTAVYRLNASRYVAVLSTVGNESRVEQDLFPRSAQHMDSFDIIILGRGAEAFFDPKTETLLGDFVAHGGSLVFARGKPYGGRFQPLAKLEPVAWGAGTTAAGRLRPTEAGRDNPIFDLGASGTLDELLERLPALDQASVTLGEKPLAVVLATAAGQENPVMLAYQRYGQGKTLSLNASGLWRWAFRENGQEESELAYNRFWISLLQWLLSSSQFLPGSDVALTSARRYYSSEQPMQFLVSTRNLDQSAFHPRLHIQGPARSIDVEPRPRAEAFVAEAGPFPPGTYQVTLQNNIGKPAELSQTLEVVSASIEKRELSADPETMRRLAEISGGAVLRAEDVGRMPEIVRHWEAARQIAHRQQPAWDRWWVLASLIALLGAEWWLRRKEGLI
jgi:hypothetical protein